MNLDESYTEYLTNQVAPPPAPPMPEPVAIDNSPSVLGVARDVSTGVGKGVVSGALEAGRNIGDTFTGGFWSSNIAPWLRENIPGLPEANVALQEGLKTEGAVEETTKSFVEPVTQIVAPGGLFSKSFRAAGIGNRYLSEALGYGAADVAAVDPQDSTLLEMGLQLINEDSSIREMLEASLSAQEDDNAFVERLKNAPRRFLEGGPVGLVFERAIEGAAMAYRALKSSPIFKKYKETLIKAGAADTAGDAMIAGAGRGSMQLDVQPEEQLRMVSARYPTAVKRDEDPVATQLNIGYKAVAADQKVLQRNTDVLRIYPGLRPNPSANAEELAGEFIDDVKQNLIYLHNKVPEQTRQRSKLWYEGANKIANDFSTKYEVPDTSVAGVMAALSPQKDWFMNVSLAERTLDVLTNQRSFVFSDEMAGRMEQIFPGPKYAALREMMTGKTLDNLTDPVEKAFFVRIHDETYADRSHRIITPEGNFSDVVLTDKGEPSGTGWGSLVEISKAVRAYESGGDRSLMTEILGIKHKVRSFYNNIIEPNSANGDVTIDTHAVAAALLRPLSGQSREVHHNFGSSPMKVKQPENWQGAANSSKTGVQGTYGLYAEAYRQAAADLGILPRELQSITWEAVRGLFTDRFKSGKNNVSDIDAIWSRYSLGELSIDEVRNAIEQRAGGIDAPSWQ